MVGTPTGGFPWGSWAITGHPHLLTHLLCPERGYGIGAGNTLTNTQGSQASSPGLCSLLSRWSSTAMQREAGNSLSQAVGDEGPLGLVTCSCRQAGHALGLLAP
jgi:hypothetical protein